jgi:hypothetical protein
MHYEIKGLEFWKIIKGAEDYAISNFGRVKRIKPVIGKGEKFSFVGKILKPCLSTYNKKTKTGEYFSLTLKNNKKIFREQLHKLILINFIGNPPTKTHQCNHKNGNKKKNWLANLEWSTPLENSRHARDGGKLIIKRGEDNVKSKLTWDIVDKIRNEYVAWSRVNGSKALSKKYNISNCIIIGIINNKRWKKEWHPNYKE